MGRIAVVSPPRIAGKGMTRSMSPTELLICTRCRRGQKVAEDAERPGAILYRRVVARGVEGVKITPVECLSNCLHGCSIVLRGAGRWIYVYGRLDETTDVETIREGAERYRATPDGLVPWRERPEHFRKNCIARIPPLETD